MKLNFKPGEDKHPSLVNEPLILRDTEPHALTCTQCSCMVPAAIEFLNGDRICAVCLTIAEVALRKELIDILIEEAEPVWTNVEDRVEQKEDSAKEPILDYTI